MGALNGIFKRAAVGKDLNQSVHQKTSRVEAKRALYKTLYIYIYIINFIYLNDTNHT